ncbi:MAG TPA: hypothetical protein VLI39_04865 [Sedimentisphaerales bacterium]|nr:hypothetical protein [Sedimentisphaerales bacterium]
MRPDNSPAFDTSLLEVAKIPKLREYAELKQMGAIENPYFTVCEDDLQLVVVSCYCVLDSRIHNSPQGLDPEWLLPTDGKLPIRQEFIPVNLDPGRNQFHLAGRQGSLQQVTLRNPEHGLIILVSHVDVRPVMTFAILEVERNNNPIEHRDYRHTVLQFAFRTGSF